MFKTKHKLVTDIFHKLFTQKKPCKYTLKFSIILKPLKMPSKLNFQSLHIWNTVLKSQPILQNSKNPCIFKHNLKQLIMSTNNNKKVESAVKSHFVNTRSTSKGGHVLARKNSPIFVKIKVPQRQ